MAMVKWGDDWGIGDNFLLFILTVGFSFLPRGLFDGNNYFYHHCSLNFSAIAGPKMQPQAPIDQVSSFPVSRKFSRFDQGKTA